MQKSNNKKIEKKKIQLELQIKSKDAKKGKD